MNTRNYQTIPLGYKQDHQDRRDKYKSDRYKLSTPPSYPSKYVLPWLPPIKDQGQTSSCTGHAATFMWEQIQVSRGVDYITFAPMFTWYYARMLEGSQNDDTGVEMRTIMQALNQFGSCPENLWPHGSPINTEPDPTAKTFSASRLPIYERCDSLDSIKYSLVVEKQAVCIGVNVRQCWYDSTTTSTGIISFIPQQEVIGGHAICICGYDDTKQLLYIANSWGIDWGDKGYLYYPYQYLTTDWFDAWTAGFDTIPTPQI